MAKVPVVRNMDTGRRAFRVLGLPVQFVAVVVVSAALVIYLGAWAADSNIEARAAAFGAPTIQASGQAPASLHQLPSDAESESWESAFLWVCPLH